MADADAESKTVCGSEAPAPQVDGVVPSQRLGPYRIVRRISDGRMSDIYEAYDESLDRTVAVKVLHRSLAQCEEHVARFRAEAARAARIIHPNVVPIYSIGEDGGLHFIVMQWVAGESLSQRLSGHVRLEPNEVLEILTQCLLGLQAAHASGVVHGQPTAGNILLERGTGRAMLVDFGMTRVAPATAGAAADTEALGQPDEAEAFTALKAIAGDPQDARADLFWLGVTAEQMFSGHMPLAKRSTSASQVEQADGGTVALGELIPGVPERLAKIVARMAAVRREDRYPTADEVLADLWRLEGWHPAGIVGPAGESVWSPKSADFGPAPQLPSSTVRWLRPNWRQAVAQRAWSLFSAHVPRMVAHLQTTGQRVDAAIAEYRRRDRALAQVVDEGEGISKELAARKASLVRAAAEAANLAQARRSLESSRQAVAELTEQQDRLEENLASLRVKQAQVHAELLALVNQRGLLEARLRRAQAGLRPERRRARRTAAALGLAAGLVLVIAVAAYPVYRSLSASAPGPAATSEGAATGPEVASLPPANSEPSGPAAPAPSAPESSTEPVPSGSKAPAQRIERVTASLPDLSVYSPATVMTFDGPPPPYVLHFSGKQCVRMGMTEYYWDWMSRPYTVVVAARLGASDRPSRIFGNLDTRPSDPPKAGWAVLLIPGDAAGSSGDAHGQPASDPRGARPTQNATEQAAEGPDAGAARLAFDYVASDGQVRRVAGRPFVPGDRWWRIAVSHPDRGASIFIHLGESQYLEVVPRGMAFKPRSADFWLGCPEFAAEEFSGDIGGFAFHHYANPSRAGFVLGRWTTSLFSFDLTPAGQVFDLSGSANHGTLVGGCEWVRLPERPLPVETERRPAPGKAMVLKLHGTSIVELLGTRGLADLDGTFTAEMWVRGLDGWSDTVLLGNGVEGNDTGSVYRYEGWSLVFSQQQRRRVLALRYPLGPGRYGDLIGEWPSIDADAWHHLAFCNTPNRRQIYLDGKPLVGDQTDQAQAILDHGTPSSKNLTIGDRRKPGGDRHDEIRAFRLSSSRRYDRPFTPPAEFTRDAETLVLLDFSRASSSPFVPDASGNGHRGLAVLAAWVEVDKTWGQ